MNPYYKNGEDIRFVMTTVQQERQLFRDAKSGDEVAREFLIRNHLLFVATLARKLTKGKLSDDEVVSAANEALMSAFKGFDCERGNRFTKYLVPFVRGAIAKLWKSKNPVDVPSEENGEEGSWTKFSHEDPHTDANEPYIDSEVESDDFKKTMMGALAQCFPLLKSKERDLIKQVYEEGKNYAEIGRTRGVTREAVRASHQRIIKKLRTLLKGKKMI